MIHQFIHKTKGSISIFLCVVLFILILTNGILVDGGRLRSADALVKSATDSAINSTLADYNTVLKEYYGLFGLSESDQSKLCEVFNYYFLPTLTGAPTEDDSVDTVLKYVNQNLSGNKDKFANAKYLDLFGFQQESLSISPMYSLGEPDPLRNQIVEFSKYRIPAFYAESAFSEAINQLANVKKDLDIVRLKMSLDEEITSFEKNLDAFTEKLPIINNEVGLGSKQSLPANFSSLKDLNKLKKLIESKKQKLSSVKTDLDSLKSQRENLINNRIPNFNDQVKKIGGTQNGNVSTADRMIEELEKDRDRFSKINFDSIRSLIDAKINSLNSSLTTLSNYNIYSSINNIDYSDLSFKYDPRPGTSDKADDGVTKASKFIKEKLNLPENKIISKEQWDILPSRTYADRKTNSNKFDADDAQKALEELDISGSFSSKNTKFMDSFNILDQLLAGLNNVLISTRDNVIVNEYIMNMFKTRATDVVFEKYPNQTPANESYVIPSRYKAEENLRWNPKRDTKTFFKKAEVEYILTGQDSENLNAETIYAQILLIRMVINLIAIYSDATTVAKISNISATAGPFAPAVFWCIIFAWAGAESYIEMRQMIDYGYKIPLFKSLLPKIDNMNLGYKVFLSGNFNLSTPNVKETDKILFSYEDYLRLFLYLKPMNIKLLRTSDLIQLNIRQMPNQTDFLMKDAYTYLRVDTTVSMKYMFMTSALMPSKYQFSAGKRHKIRNVFYQGY